MSVKGKVWKYGDDVNTDVIFPGKYTYTIKERADMAKVACEDLDPEFTKNAKPGDIIVGGKNWGCGSSREQAVSCLKERGIAAIIAKSFARIYYRNCFNEGLPIIICADAVEAINAGDEVEIDFDRGIITAGGKEYPFPPYPEFVQGLIKDGGLIPHVKKELKGGAATMTRNIMKVKETKDRYDVTYMAGDDSGFDMMEGALLVLEAMDLPINWHRADLGWCMWEKSNKKFGEGDPRCNTVPPETIKSIKETDATLMAAITSKAGVKGFKSAILQMRQLFDLYINIRPAKKLPGIGTPLAKDPDIDIVMFRENTEDLYAAVEFFPLPKEMFDLHPGMERFKEGKGDIAVSWRVFSEKGCERIIRAAFEYAKATGRKTVHCGNKANVIRQTDGMMKRKFLEIAKEYEQYGIKAYEENADATAMWLIKNPQDYSVVVASNVFGDILSDEASQLTGGLGFAPSGNIGVNAAIFEPSSGSVPKYAHQYRVNPSAMIMTAKMMLEYLGLDEAAAKIEKALGEVLVENKPGTLTYDVLRDFRGDPDWEKNAASTIEMAAAIAQKLNPEFKGEKLEAAKEKVHKMCAWDEASLIGFND